ncbi:hypothetical protein AB0H76_15190 [Nocardia sp. NPDC050712]|uniref:hypothetical protein n=1 Tax=Nocardia sp. NPDC050712 TaxID=3155518 RepID=UPI0033C74A22
MTARYHLRTPEGAEALASLRTLAAAADKELAAGMPLPIGDAMLAHMTGGLGFPGAALILLDMVDELLAED